MTTPNFDTILDRLHERVSQGGNGYSCGHCDNCHARLTTADIEAGECTACHSSIESDDEDLWEG